jgi:hypothetical protein
MTLQPDITLRDLDGTLYNEPLGTNRFMLERHWRIILIHGFRNSQSEALQSYEHFRSNLYSYSGFFANQLFYLVWPGDVLPFNPLRFLLRM